MQNTLITIGLCFSVHYRVMEHAVSLESTQEARVALGYRFGKLFRFFPTLQTSRLLYLTIGTLRSEKRRL